jgi:hypothetical protein
MASSTATPVRANATLDVDHEIAVLEAARDAALQRALDVVRRAAGRPTAPARTTATATMPNGLLARPATPGTIAGLAVGETITVIGQALSVDMTNGVWLWTSSTAVSDTAGDLEVTRTAAGYTVVVTNLDTAWAPSPVPASRSYAPVVSVTIAELANA